MLCPWGETMGTSAAKRFALDEKRRHFCLNPYNCPVQNKAAARPLVHSSAVRLRFEAASGDVENSPFFM